VQFLAQNYTAAGDSYYDLADAGATVDSEVIYSNGAVRPFVPPSSLSLTRYDREQTDFEGQTGEFLAYFNSTTSTVQWDSDTSLFSASSALHMHLSSEANLSPSRQPSFSETTFVARFSPP
jgi:hypothetical protein